MFDKKAFVFELKHTSIEAVSICGCFKGRPRSLYINIFKNTLQKVRSLYGTLMCLSNLLTMTEFCYADLLGCFPTRPNSV